MILRPKMGLSLEKLREKWRGSYSSVNNSDIDSVEEDEVFV
jgi:hypothetical protein